MGNAVLHKEVDQQVTDRIRVTKLQSHNTVSPLRVLQMQISFVLKKKKQFYR